MDVATQVTHVIPLPITGEGEDQDFSGFELNASPWPKEEGDPSIVGLSRMLAQSLPKAEELDRPTFGWGGSRLNNPVVFPSADKDFYRNLTEFKLTPDDGGGRRADASEPGPFTPFPFGENDKSSGNPFLLLDRPLQDFIEPDAVLRPNTVLPARINVEYSGAWPNVRLRNKKTGKSYMLLMGSFPTEKKPYFLERKVLIEMTPPGSPQRVWLATSPSTATDSGTKE